MQIPKKIYISGYDIVSMNLTMPNGKKFRMKRGDSFITSDPEELDFFSKQKGIAVADIDIKELKRFIAQVEIPIIENTLITSENADKFKWNTEEEAMVVEKLKERGYTVISSSAEKSIPIPSVVVKPKVVLEPKPIIKPVRKRVVKRRAIKKK